MLLGSSRGCFSCPAARPTPPAAGTRASAWDAQEFSSPKKLFYKLNITKMHRSAVLLAPLTGSQCFTGHYTRFTTPSHILDYSLLVNLTFTSKVQCAPIRLRPLAVPLKLHVAQHEPGGLHHQLAPPAVTAIEELHSFEFQIHKAVHVQNLCPLFTP